MNRRSFLCLPLVALAPLVRVPRQSFMRWCGIKTDRVINVRTARITEYLA